MSMLNISAEENPITTKDSEDIVEVEDGKTVTYTASGGSTDQPSSDLGCPPWTKTGNRQYTWHVVQVESGPMSTDPADETTTSSDTLVVDVSSPGKIKVSVSLQEEWRDSSETPQTLFWPE